MLLVTSASLVSDCVSSGGSRGGACRVKREDPRVQ